MGSSECEKREISGSPNDIGLQGLLKDLKSLQIDGSKNGDLKFTLEDGIQIGAHSLIIKQRCKAFKGDLIYPNVSEETFSTFLTYIYTGKLKLDSSLKFYQLYLLSLDFNVEELSITCEDLIISNLNHNTALRILQEATVKADHASDSSISGVKSAIKKFDSSVTHVPDEVTKDKLQRVIDTCITFLSENNPVALKRNPNFLSLPTETLITILDSEHFCLEEEDVWRCILRWAQFKAGVDSHVSKWTESERIKVSNYLTPVISHVKLLLIDSRIFAEEVEPTGCVSLSLSLERYKYAALSTFETPEGQVTSDPRLKPRNAQKLFHSSLIINNERSILGKKLQEWHLSANPESVETNWRCIYRGTQHGFGADKFHTLVDGFAPTYVLVVMKNSKWVCGGYTDVAWSSPKSPKFMASSKSFLFAMNPSTNGQPLQFPVAKKHFAVCLDPNSGPIFGAGSDLFISSNCASNSDSYSNLPHSYETADVNCDKKNAAKGSDLSSPTLAPSYHFTVADYEVFVPNV